MANHVFWHIFEYLICLYSMLFVLLRPPFQLVFKPSTVFFNIISMFVSPTVGVGRCKKKLLVCLLGVGRCKKNSIKEILLGRRVTVHQVSRN